MYGLHEPPESEKGSSQMEDDEDLAWQLQMDEEAALETGGHDLRAKGMTHPSLCVPA